MPQRVFGSGTMWGTTSATNATPIKLGDLQNCGLDFTANTKSLIGQNQFPVAVARGAISIKGKSQFARFNAPVINELFFGATSAAGQIVAIEDESGTIPTTPFTVTVANSTTWTTDLGVIDTTSGVPLTRVAAAPATGQYSVAAGVYTFAAADTGKGVKISYVYTVPTTGQTVTIANQAMGVANTFKTSISLQYNSQKTLWTLNACVSSKFSFQSALEDFTKPSFDFEAFADAAGNIGTISFAEAR